LDTTTAGAVSIRKPCADDMAGVKRLIDGGSATGQLLPRSVMELYEHMRDFTVYVDEQGVGGCCALHVDTADLAEVRSLVVRPELRGHGIGEMLLRACLDEAATLRVARVYALTRIPAFFERFGFSRIDKRELPHKVFKDCVRCHLFPDCDEVAMIRDMGVRRPTRET